MLSLEDIKTYKEFDKHQAFYTIEDQSIGLKAYIAIHRKGSKNIAFGATRLWKYDSDEDAIRDALRLSKTMSYKSAFAGLFYGGAKAVIMSTPLLLKNRDKVFAHYAKFVETLGGQFVTGTDVGLSSSDLEIMNQNSQYIVGNKVNPEHFTALGLLYAIETGLEELYHNSSIKNRTFSILGLGKIGLSILELLYPKAGKLYVSEIDSKRLTIAKERFPNIIIKESADLLQEPVDVFVPCAVVTTINHHNVNQLNCKAVVGGSNNQLEDETIAMKLLERDILYAPDFIVNDGGLISVVHEYENKEINEMEIHEKLLYIKESLRLVFVESQLTNVSTVFVAKKIMEKVYQTADI